MNIRRANRAYKAMLGSILMLASASLSLYSSAQTAPGPSANVPQLNGDWAGLWEVLANGEQNRVFLDLHQEGQALTGTLSTLGHVTKVKGTLAGTHFELRQVDRRATLQLTGEVKGTTLALVRDGHAFDAYPAKPGDNYPGYKTNPLPATVDLPGNDLAKAPPMGWNSWNFFGERTDDKIVRDAADALVSSGMRDAGYVYVNIDDTWEGTRDAQGKLMPNTKFPDMKALADYVHSRGLKLGIYSSPGPRTCQDYPGSYGYEEQDAKTYAGWGIDFLKYDWCGARMIYTNAQSRPVYQIMGQSLLHSGRPILYSLCQYGTDEVQQWGAKVAGNMWRTTGDIKDTWVSMMENIEKQVPDAAFAGPGHWNDPDMLEIGNGGMTETEYRTHLALWAISAAPLLAGNDLQHMTPAIAAILMNREVIAIDQDARGIQAVPSRNGNLETWVKPLADGSVSVAVVNLGESATSARITAQQLGLAGKVESGRDVWAHADVAFHDGVYTTELPKHGVAMLRVRASR